MGVKDNFIYEECMKELDVMYGERPTLGKNYKGFKDLTHTNMCYRCDYCDQGYNQIYWLKQIEERVEAKYSKRIEYLVNANNELMYELEQCELECYGRGYEGTTTYR